MKVWLRDGINKLVFGFLLFFLCGFCSWLTTMYLTQQEVKADIVTLKVRQEERYMILIKRLDRVEDKIDKLI